MTEKQRQKVVNRVFKLLEKHENAIEKHARIQNDENWERTLETWENLCYAILDAIPEVA